VAEMNRKFSGEAEKSVSLANENYFSTFFFFTMPPFRFMLQINHQACARYQDE
jgi:hypothetical protein